MFWYGQKEGYHYEFLSDSPVLPPVSGISRPNRPDGFNTKLHDIGPSGAIDKALDTDGLALPLRLTCSPLTSTLVH